MKRISVITIYIIFNFAYFSAFSQGKVSGGSGGFSIGYKSYNTGSYESFLEEGVGGLRNNLFTMGGGGYTIIDNWMIGAFGFYQGGESKEVIIGGPLMDGIPYTYTLQGGGSYFTLGHVVYHTEKLIAFPQLGVGYEALSLQKNVSRDVVYGQGDLLSAEYIWASPMLDLGAGIDIFPFDNGLKLGIRIGYQISTERGNNDWNHEGGSLIGNDLPENDLDGLYLSLTVGGGGIEF